MQKLYSFIALVGLLVPTIASAYTVQSGDTLWRIAQSHNTTVSQLVEDNGIKNPNLIYPGQELMMGGVLGATTKIKLTDPNSVTPYATTTPTAGALPMADASSSLNSWISPYKLTKNFIAGQDLTAGNALIVGDGTSTYVSINQSSVGSNSNITNTTWYGQTFLSSAKAVSLKSLVLNLNGTNRTATVSIRATSGGIPTGSDLEGKTTTASVNSSGDFTFTFSSPVTLSANTTYAVIVRMDSNIGPPSIVYNNANPYANGALYVSNNSGSTWADSAGSGLTNDARFSISEIQTISGRVYKASSALNNFYANSFIGFAGSSVSSTVSVPVIITGVSNVQTGLTVGSTYYLNDTDGSIGASAGSQSRKVGIAVSATELLIKHDNP